MPPSSRDAAYLWDMLNASRTVAGLTADISKSDYLEDTVRQLAVERSLEIVGEAARNVSSELKALHPEIPWRKIIGQRHVLAHDYGAVDHQRLWGVASEAIHDLIASLERLIDR